MVLGTEETLSRWLEAILNPFSTSYVYYRAWKYKNSFPAFLDFRGVH